MQQREKSHSHRSATQRRSPAKVQYALDLEAAMAALEVKLNEERICENAVSHVVQTIRDFYDADCVLVLSVNLQIMTARCVYKIHRHGIKQSIIESLLVPGSPEMLQELMQARIFVPIDTRAFAGYAKSYEEFAAAGVRSVVVAPYGVAGEGLVMVCDPKKYSSFGTLLQFASYAITVELSHQRKRQELKPKFQTQCELSADEVYVKLLDGFELHTKAGVATEQSIGRKQGILFLVLLLLQKGRALSVQSLLNSLWDDLDVLDVPERALKNLSYNVRKKIEHLFAGNNFLEIHKTGYAINSRYTITTDFDRFVLRIQEADQLPDPEAKLGRYIKALDTFQGVVLPRHNARVIARIVEQYDRKRSDIQNVSLSLMFLMKQFERMSDFIDQTSVARWWDRDLHYWDIKAKLGMQMISEAKAVFLANKEKFSDLQLRELDVFS